MNEDFQDMIAFVRKIEELSLSKEIDTEGISLNSLRKDDPDSWTETAPLSNAPNTKDGYVVVPKVKGV